MPDNKYSLNHLHKVQEEDKDVTCRYSEWHLQRRKTGHKSNFMFGIFIRTPGNMTVSVFGLETHIKILITFFLTNIFISKNYQARYIISPQKQALFLSCLFPYLFFNLSCQWRHSVLQGHLTLL